LTITAAPKHGFSMICPGVVVSSFPRLAVAKHRIRPQPYYNHTPRSQKTGAKKPPSLHGGPL
jgi:hypothetical protein